ncbi:MAG: SEC-C domain-containing protein [Candidatus Eisenbacteria sp.]|nr:SEC-C domain-containing protein [Candidatus Eisenbacteria bacterium]
MKLGRNDRCWCGSGRKYKKCHYDSDQKHFSRLRTATCRASS